MAMGFANYKLWKMKTIRLGATPSKIETDNISITSHQPYPELDAHDIEIWSISYEPVLQIKYKAKFLNHSRYQGQIQL